MRVWNAAPGWGVDPSQIGPMPNKEDFYSKPTEGFGDLNKKFTVADFYNDPVTKLGLEFGLKQGTTAIDRMAGARGMRHSGQTLKALTQFGNDYAGTKAGESYNRFYGDQDRIFNRLAGTSGSGQTATVNTNNAGMNMANNISGLLSAQGNARGAAAIAGGNAWNQGAGTIGNWWSQRNMIEQAEKRNSRQPSDGGWQNNYIGGTW